MRSFGVSFFIITIFSVMGVCPAYAQGIITFGPKETKIEGSIKYSVIGKYIAHFNNFKGRVVLGDDLQTIRSVYLDIQSNSITSNCPWCDKIVKSQKLLNTSKFPEIVFKSDKIIHDENGFKVKGILAMHGIKRSVTFPFSFEVINDQSTHDKTLDLKGAWSINRKSFNIIWNKFFDHGGVLVSDIFTVDWGIKKEIKP